MKGDPRKKKLTETGLRTSAQGYILKIESPFEKKLYLQVNIKNKIHVRSIYTFFNIGQFF